MFHLSCIMYCANHVDFPVQYEFNVYSIIFFLRTKGRIQQHDLRRE